VLQSHTVTPSSFGQIRAPKPPRCSCPIASIESVETIMAKAFLLACFVAIAIGATAGLVLPG
jgi:hypothetical protein